MAAHHRMYMQRCIDLAQQGSGYAAPNPMVGAVLVHRDRIIGEGYHQQWGGPHAEVNCLNSVSHQDRQLIADATLYVSLEPCAHHGKTPPCTDLIIRHKIPRVVIGCRDPFPAVNGKGIEQLKDAGVAVECGILEEECRYLNRRFFTFHQKHRPYIVLKWAQSKDGFIGGTTDKRIFISNEFTNRLVHRWRSEEASILVGTRTAALDNPSLNVRGWKGHQPVRMVLDRMLRLPNELSLFDQSQQTIVFNGSKATSNGQVQYVTIAGNDVVAEIVAACDRLQIQSILVEGGRMLLQSFIDAGLWDEARVITGNQLLLHEGVAAPTLHHQAFKEEWNLLSDTITVYQHHRDEAN